MTVNGYVDQLDWSPDGTRIAFIAEPCSLVPLVPATPTLDCEGGFGGPGPEYHPNLYVVTPSTGTVRALTQDRRTWTSVAWSPDGTMLAATVNEGAGGDPAIVRLPAGGGAPTTVVEPGTRDVCNDDGACAEVPQAVSSVDWQPCTTATTASCRAVTSVDVSTAIEGPAAAVPLEDLTYEARLTNTGPDPAPGASVTFTWSGGTFVSVDAALPCRLGTGSLVCSADVLGRAVTRSVTLRLLAPAGPGPVRVTATGDSSATDAVPGNDASSVDTLVSEETVPVPPSTQAPLQAPTTASPLADADRDTVPDTQDNCPTQGNPDQADDDGDGHRDVCDPVHGRVLRLRLRKHLVATGVLTASSERSCASGQRVEVQRRAGSSWRRVARISTKTDGSFRVSLADRVGRYRATLSPVVLADRWTSCARARSATVRHGHG
ncbi:hypothetical protein ACNKF0_06070 [Nocardioides sp. T5]|uniref:hypothetical protein n=1 Tax=Nocardioides sp. T5 TaxID=3400182 RepID=UPI003A8BBD8D